MDVKPTQSDGKDITCEKRKRKASSCCWWDEWVRLLESRGGIVHSAISFSSDGERKLFVTEQVREGEILFQIPHACLVCCETVQSTEIGTKLRNAIKSLNLHNNQQDVLIALALAHQLDSNEGNWGAYLQTLPPLESFDSLPRRWPLKQLQELLRGSTCFLRRLQEASEGSANDLKQIEQALGRSYPSFDTMLAVVTSRAFAGMGGDGNNCMDENVALLPLLDLCNHIRGAKNVSYQRQGSSAVASARVSLQPGDELCITYGAKGNHQLLFNYGFCLQRNIEPDGSSNDVCEVMLKDTGVSLRTGPKSYTFGCLSRAVELFHKVTCSDQSKEEACGADDAQGGLASFLDECEDEAGIDEFSFDEGDDDDEANDEEDVKAEIEALQNLNQALLQVQGAYGLNGSKLKEALKSSDDRIRNAGILILSELQTVQFYVLATQRVVERLRKVELQEFQWMAMMDSHTVCQLESQVVELVDAFIRIRYPTIVT